MWFGFSRDGVGDKKSLEVYPSDSLNAGGGHIPIVQPVSYLLSIQL